MDVATGACMYYAGEEAVFMDADTLCYQCGNSVKFLNVKTGKENFLGGVSYGISQVVCSPTAGLVVYADAGMSPNICLYSYPRLRPVGTLSGAAELSFDAIAISRDGTSIAAVSGSPDLVVTVWTGGPDWAEPVVAAVAPLPLGAVSLKFNPLDATELCCFADGKVSLFKLESSGSKATLESWSPMPEDAMEEEITSYGWAPSSKLLVGTASGAVQSLDLSAHEPGQTLAQTTLCAPSGVAATSISATKENVVVGYADGSLEWAVESGGDPLRSQVAAAQVACIAPTPDFGSLWVGMTDGSLSQVTKSAEGEVEVVAAYSFNASPVLSTDTLHWKGKAFVVTVSADGCLRVWDTATGKLAGSHSSAGSAELTSLAICSVTGLAAVGNSAGSVRLLDLTNPAAITTIYRGRLHTGATAHVSFSPDGSVLASAGADGRLFFMDAAGAASFGMLGYYTLPALASCICWRVGQAEDSDGEGLHLLVCTAGKQLLQLAPPTGAPPADLHLSSLAVDMRCWRVDAPLVVMGVSPASSGVLFAFGPGKRTGKALRTYDLRAAELTQASGVDGGAKPNALKFTVPADMGHQKDGTSIAFSSDGTMMATGGADGAVVVRSVGDGSVVSTLRRHNVASAMSATPGGVSGVTFGSSGDLYTVGLEGSIFQVLIKGYSPPAVSIPHSRSDQIEGAAAVPETGTVVADGADSPAVAVSEAEEPDVITVFMTAASEAGAAEAGEAVVTLKESLAALKGKFQECLRNNDVVPELEKMDRQEFVIDVEKVSATKAAADAEAAALKASIGAANAERSARADEIIAEYYGPMLVHLTNLNAFDESGVQVPNFALRKRTDEDEALLQTVVATRKAEIAERAHLAAAHPADLGVATNTEGEASDDEADGTSAAAAPAAAAVADADEDEAADGGADDDDEEGGGGGGPATGNASMVEALLYDPLELATSRRKRAQMVLLEAKVLEERQKYNKLFDATMTAKLNTIDGVNEKRKRLGEILEELGGLGEGLDIPAEPRLSAEEHADSVLAVEDREIAAPKWVSPQEQARRDEEEAARLKREAEAHDSPFERALMEMMGGALDGNENKMRLDEVFEKPEWMVEAAAAMEADPENDTPKEEQLKEMAEFDAMVAARKVEVDKAVSILKTEYRKTIAEIAEICEKFDNSLANMFKQWMVASQTVFEIELWLVRLGNSVLTEEELLITEQTLRDDLQVLMLSKSEANREHKEFGRALAVEQESLDGMVAEDRAMDRGFKKEFADAAEHLDDLMRAYKARVRPTRDGVKLSFMIDPEMPEAEGVVFGPKKVLAPPADATANVPDPWEAIETAAAAAAAAAAEAESVDPLEKQYDCPDSLPGYIWDRLVIHRDAKVKLESDTKQQAGVVASMKTVLSKLAAKDGAMKGTIDEMQASLQRCLKDIVTINSDLELQLKLKQGQVEVEQSAVVTDLGDAVLIPNTVVMELNRYIKIRGREKVSILEEIKAGGKRTAELNWEKRRCMVETHDLKETTRDFQLMRVTKDLQELIKGGYSDVHAQVNAALEAKVNALKKQHEANLSARKQALRRLVGQTKEKLQANTKLEQAIMEASVAVAQREQIATMQLAAADKEGLARRKMKEVVTRRRLLELARAQTDEVDILREELDRLRQRTFPSFHQLQHRGGLDAGEFAVV